MLKVILTAKEIKSLYDFCLEKGNVNIAIGTEPAGGIGEITRVMTQEDFLKNKTEWQDITDYKSW